MLSDESKQAIDRLTREELDYETNRGHSSRFQGEKFDYLKTRLDFLNQQENREQVENQLELDVEANRIAGRANELAAYANATSNKAYRIAVFSVVIAVLATLIALLPQCAGKP